MSSGPQEGVPRQVLFINKISASQEPKTTINYKQLAEEKILEQVTQQDSSLDRFKDGLVAPLLGDYPLLVKDNARRTPGRDADTIFANKTNAKLVPQQENRGPSRFSFRKLESSGKWQPLNGSTTKNGDKVTLWCHSLEEGGWKSLSNPPASGAQAMYNRDVRFNVPSQTFTAVNGYAPAIFTVEYI